MSEMTNHSNFSAADIEKYWRGQLTPSQMHALEKAALEDPFLADAMDGYQERSRRQAMGKDMQELEQRLRARVEEKEPRTIAFGYWWKIAAAVIVLIGGVWVYRSMNSNNQRAELAKNEPFKPAAAPAAGNAKVSTDSVQVTTPATATKPTTSANANAFLKTESRQAKEKAPLLADKEKREQFNRLQSSAPGHSFYSRSDSASITVAPPAADLSAAKSVSAESLQGRLAGVDVSRRKKTQKDTVAKASGFARDKISDVAKISSVDDLLKRVPGLEVTPEGKAKTDTVQQIPDYATAHVITPSPGKDQKIMIRGTNPALNTFNGQVVDNRSQPVQGASVMVPGTKTGVSTDNNGYFTLKTRDTAVNVSIASIGFQQQNAMLRNNVSSFGPSSNQIVLQPANTSLDEVVVIGYGTQRKKDVTGSVSVRVLNAEPVVGWDKYSNYLTANKKIPDSSATVHGFVVVRFTVSRGGKIRNVKIEKSLNKTLDAEAIRLVKNGPAWKVLKGKRAKASVMVRF